ncbi:MAG: tetratricopeptide repeat protein [Thermanaerothrix sp.]|uniref:tetratricopeptide repeat protein n=1 Tax=Thermanaerothrix sp. TaxID=2972675 RepID=UPI003C7BFD7E
MPKISLRAYNREIENLIENGQTDAAIAHCRHILKFFPKHIDTYRLLGKAYLEAQHYAEAADIFHRVLSSVPDDFISQIGMSIIREDEGNLDAAIWHMERAFETQPSNTAIQDELRRLYGRRDGVEPPRIRLSRGALIRMYARGELYPQAIAEARAALAEDPNRVDLEVILARVYYLSGQKVAATEVCTRLVGKLPYCFEANRILAEILPTTSRAQDAAIYRQRVIAMDPYLAYMTPGMLSPLEVPDDAVMLDYLEWQPELETPAQPEWTRTVGVTWLAEEEEALPDWYSALQEQSTATDVAPSETTPPENILAEATEETTPAEPETLIPDWMREAGWEMRTSGLAEEEPQESAPFQEEATESLVEPAEIPEWLKGIVPPDLKTETEESPEQAEAWFENLLQSGATQTRSDIEEVSPPEAGAEFEASLTTPLSEEEPPTWLADLTTPDSVTLEETTESPTEWPHPGWAVESTPSSPAHEESSTMADMAAETPLAADEVAPPAITAASPSAEEITPDLQPLEAVPTSSEDIEAALAWLESLAARQGADEATLTTPASERLDQPPAWVIQAQETEIETTPPTYPPEAPSEIEKTTTTEGAEQVIPHIETEPSLTSGSPTEVEIPLDSEATFAWLEGLAARQGADEETLLTPPEQRFSHLPDWVSAQREPGEELIKTPEEAPIASEETAISFEKSTASEVSGLSEAAPTTQEAIPEWLQEVLEPPVTPLEETETPISALEIPSSEPLVTIEDTQPVRIGGSIKSTPQPPVEEENIPAWLQEPSEPTSQVLGEEESVWIPEQPLPLSEESQPTVEAVSEASVETTLLWLHEAQNALQAGNLERALQFYNRLIQEAQHLEDVIHDLHEALYRYPIDVGLWQALGDAYVRSNRLQEALDAYTKAEELLR